MKNTGIKSVLTAACVNIDGVYFGEDVDGVMITPNDLIFDIFGGLGFGVFTRHDVNMMTIPYGEPYIVGWDVNGGEYVEFALKISGIPDSQIPSPSAIIRMNENSALWKAWVNYEA